MDIDTSSDLTKTTMLTHIHVSGLHPPALKVLIKIILNSYKRILILLLVYLFYYFRVISADINDYCECTLSKEDIVKGITGCDDRCLNRLLKVEW